MEKKNYTKSKDGVVYRTKRDRKNEKKSDWEIRLIAVSICMRQNHGKIISKKVKDIYNNLLIKFNK